MISVATSLWKYSIYTNSKNMNDFDKMNSKILLRVRVWVHTWTKLTCKIILSSSFMVLVNNIKNYELLYKWKHLSSDQKFLSSIKNEKSLFDFHCDCLGNIIRQKYSQVRILLALTSFNKIQQTFGGISKCDRTDRWWNWIDSTKIQVRASDHLESWVSFLSWNC